MKRIVIVGGLLAAAVLLSSCAGLPKPSEEESSLVLGSLILDFPDGFYDTAPRSFDMSVQMSFRNTTQNKRFDVYTNRGYFHFRSNGTDEYVLEEFQLLNLTIGNTRYSFGSAPVNMKIVPSPNKVVYLGHILFTYTAPGATAKQGRTTYYNYETKVSVDFDRETLQEYLMQKGGDAWLTMGIVEYGKK